MFLGTHNPRLDDKGRVILPAKFREGLAEGVVITKGQERCLYVFPEAEFTRIAEALQQAPMSSKTARAYSRCDSRHTNCNHGRNTNARHDDTHGQR